jgi:hypothetical protein
MISATISSPKAWRERIYFEISFHYSPASRDLSIVVNTFFQHNRQAEVVGRKLEAQAYTIPLKGRRRLPEDPKRQARMNNPNAEDSLKEIAVLWSIKEDVASLRFIASDPHMHVVDRRGGVGQRVRVDIQTELPHRRESIVVPEQFTVPQF